MMQQLHKGEVAQALLERINELTKVCNDAETAETEEKEQVEKIEQTN
ncbi:MULTISPECIES: hypothetical protein [Bacillus]|nr:MULTISPECIES: hypothetical protein [Bacillus]MBZ4223108.1 hypothetical protein [Bacillus wiedmannii]